ncbi:hypothetical protein RMB03_17410 [Acinetobacter sp. V91_7]|uniref:hypothetical protein n=1 Tax=unclassified Acinetobacter TaxID=196816 RepID=UPI00287D3D25|nr:MULTISPECIES: hypothetical protein [unclassified Acinetobacter]MDS7935665.1 hypothetical protein [Acinetobacter sp. V91_4B]MDS7964727.1 hypothetical protein [Acinetobacter sp. V91_7]MDS8025578.1 hypothetical protein [Acinetobacter sp. V91_13]
MNLRGLANGVTSTVNRNTPATLKVNIGYETSPSGKQVPKFENEPVTIQLQSIETKDLERLNLVSQQAQYSFAYLNGRVSAIRRSKGAGSEQLIFKPYGEDEEVIWNVTKVIESYPNWVKVLICRQ